MSGVPQHAHGHHGGQRLGRVVADMLLEQELAVKVEAKVLPGSLGLEGGVAGVWCIA